MAPVAICGALVLVLQGSVVLEDFEAPLADRWEFRNGAEFPGATGSFERSSDAAGEGDYGGRLSFDFTGGGAYVEAALPVPAALDAQAIELTIRRTLSNALAVRFTDGEGQTFQKALNLPMGVWQRVRVYPDRWSVSWGGAADGVFRGPLTRVSLVADQSGGSRTGWVDFDNVTALTDIGGGGDPPVMALQTITRFEDWSFRCEGDAGGTQRQAGSLDYDFSGSSEAVFSSDVSLLADPQTVRLRVFSDGSGHEVRLSLGSHFQTFTTTLGTLDEVGEMTLEAPIGDMSAWSYGGGENDGVKRPPLRALRVAVRPVEGGPRTGTIELLALEAETRIPSAREALFPVARPRNGAVALCITSLATEAMEADVQTEFVDWEGLRLGGATQRVALPAGESTELTIPYDGEPRSFVEARIAVQGEGQRSAAATCALVGQLPEAPSPALDPSSPWGMGLYLYRYDLSAASLADMDRAAALAAAAGVKWSREEMQWHRIETAKGEFNWDFYDRVVDTATRHGISVYGLIAYWSGWTEPYTEQGIQDYCDFAQALVRRYGDRIKHWEIWNEPNIFFWSGPREVYFELLDRAYEAIKEIDPEAVVFGCSTAGIDNGFVEQTMDAGSRFDGLTIHPYRGGLDDLGFVAELQAAAELVARDGVDRPVWITEMGWPTQIGGTTEREQARYLARCYVDAVASGVIGNMGWYNFRDDGTNPYYNEHSFGVVRHDFTPKPAYRALAAVCGTLAGLEPLGPPQVDAGGLLTARFGSGDRWVTACWSVAEPAILDVGSDTTVVNAMAEVVEPLAWGDERVIPLGANTPVFLRSAEGEPTVRTSALSLELSSSAARPGESVSVALTGIAGADGFQAEWSVPQGLTVEPDGDGSWRITVAEDATAGKVEAALVIRIGEGQIALSVALEVVPTVLEI